MELERKSAKDFPNQVKKIFHLISITRNYKVIGSGGLKDIIYNADYDLSELYEKSKDTETILTHIYHLFKSKFERASKNQDVFITDFKCGQDSDLEPLRWNKTDMKKGFKILKDGRKMRFQDCILAKTTMKLDMVVLIKGRFVEFSDNYLVRLGNDANYFPHDIDKEHSLNSIKHSFDEYFYSMQNPFKALKRCFAYWVGEGKKSNEGKIKKLMAFFNSPVGLLYKLSSEIDTIFLVLEQTFRRPKISDIKKNVAIILESLNSLDLKQISSLLEKAIEARTEKSLADYLEKSKKAMTDLINAETLDFILKNKNVVLY